MSKVWEELIIAVLAVSQYPIEKVEPHRSAIREAGLFRVNDLAEESIGSLTNKLKKAGYDRGKLTWQFADRLISLGKHVVERDQLLLEQQLSAGDERVVEATLIPIYGIGPKVVENFIELRRRAST